MRANNFENTTKLFEKIKSMGFFERIFHWRQIISLSMEAFNEFKSVDKEISSLNDKCQELNSEIIRISKDNEHIKETKNKLEKENDKIKTDLERNNKDIQQKEKQIGKLSEAEEKNNNRITELSKDIDILKVKRDDLVDKNKENEKEIISFKKIEIQKQKEYEHKVTELNSLKKQLDDDRLRIQQAREDEIRIQFEKMKETWRNHEVRVEQTIKNICNKYSLEYIEKEKVPFKGKPDNAVKICDYYVIFDAKSPASDDLENFPSYIKTQAEAAKKYVKEKDVKKDIFLVVPSNTLENLPQFYYNLADYNVYVIGIDSLEPVILSLQKIEDYEFAEKLSPEDRENICRIIGKFAHTTKRRIQVDNYFAQEFINIYGKCSSLPEDLLNKAVEFEKSDKLNPPQEKRAKLISEQDLKKETKKIKQKAEAEEIKVDAEGLAKIEEVQLYK